MNTPDPKHAAGGETEVEITDLDSPSPTGKIPGRSTRRPRMPSLQVRIWMSMAVIAGIALFVAIVLVSVPVKQKVARMTIPPHINYPVSLSVVDGVCYTSSPVGTVTALRINDGSLLWRHEGGRVGEASATVVDGVVYLAPFNIDVTTVTVEALRASDGSLLWSRTFPSHTLPTDSYAALQLTIVNRVVYIRPEAESIDALRTGDGSVLWHYIPRTSLVSMSVTDGVVYAGTRDGQLSALRASDGLTLWRSALPIPPSPAPPIMADGMVFLSLQDGSMEVLRADTGVLLWRSSPHVPALQWLSPLLTMDGVVYARTQDGHLNALRASDGLTLWSVAHPATNLLPDMIMTGGVVYVGALDGSAFALRASDGSVFWRYHSGEGAVGSITFAQGVLYLALLGGDTKRIAALRASDGVVLWRSTPYVPAMHLSPVVANGLVLIAMDDGSIDALSASNGSLRWHREMNS